MAQTSSHNKLQAWMEADCGKPPIADLAEMLKTVFEETVSDESTLPVLLSFAMALPPMAASQKNDNTLFQGCQSQVWLVLTQEKTSGLTVIHTDSDARLMRSILAITRGIYHARTREEIIKYPPSTLESLGLAPFLVPSRANGFHRILKHIYYFAKQIKAP